MNLYYFLVSLVSEFASLFGKLFESVDEIFEEKIATFGYKSM